MSDLKELNKRLKGRNDRLIQEIEARREAAERLKAINKEQSLKIETLKQRIIAINKWDEWTWYRTRYDSLSFEEKKLLHEMWYHKYPIGRLYRGFGDMRFFFDSLKRINNKLQKEDIKVAELGGRDGALAFFLFRKHPNLKWTNFEIIKHQEHKDLDKFQYTEHELSAEFWEEKPNINEYDVFLSRNTIEHLSDNDAKNLFNYLSEEKVKYLVLRICTSPGGQEWRGYIGSHVLKMGSREITRLLNQSYNLIRREPYESISSYRAWCSFWVLRRRRQ